jgi:hypothetical protein
MYNLEI